MWPFVTCQLNSTTDVVHAVFIDPDDEPVYYTMCGTAISRFGEYTKGATTSDATNCRKCIAAMQKAHLTPRAPVASPDFDLDVLYLATSPGLIQTHYFYPVKAGQQFAVCGTRVIESKHVITLAEVYDRATCARCLASPKVPARLQDTDALRRFADRGKYDREFSATARIIE